MKKKSHLKFAYGLPKVLLWFQWNHLLSVFNNVHRSYKEGLARATYKAFLWSQWNHLVSVFNKVHSSYKESFARYSRNIRKESVTSQTLDHNRNWWQYILLDWSTSLVSGTIVFVDWSSGRSGTIIIFWVDNCIMLNLFWHLMFSFFPQSPLFSTTRNAEIETKEKYDKRKILLTFASVNPISKRQYSRTVSIQYRKKERETILFSC